MSVQETLKDLAFLKTAMIRKDDSQCKRLITKYETILRSLQLEKNNYRSLVSVPEDDLATLLMPEDVPVQLIAKRSTADGNCLYNSASMAVYGSEKVWHILRLLVAGELYLNARYYASHPHFQRLLGKTHYTANCIFAMSLSCDYPDIRDMESIVRQEAIATCIPRKWSALIQVMALASVLRRPVFSVYPIAHKAMRPLLHGKVFPRLQESAQLQCSATTSRTVYIMFSRDSNLNSKPGVVFQPNHFVPLFPAHDIEDTLPSFDEDDFPPLSRSAQSQATSKR